MYDKQKNLITFPHVIPMPVLDGKKYTQNDINGGTVRIADLNIATNTFWGGNVLVVGMINEFGFYACPSRYDNSIQGFYVHDGSKVTDKGKEVLAKRFPGIEIAYDSSKLKDEITPEEIQHIKELKQEAMRVGISAGHVTNISAKELEGLIKAMSSGVNEAKNVEIEEPALESYGEDFVHTSADGTERVSKETRQSMEARSATRKNKRYEI